jgi:uncharacterized protein YegP (UPF0339 family)
MPRDLELKVYTDGKSRLRWKALAGNGEQLARSPRGYREEEQIMADIRWLLEENRDPEIYRDNSVKREYRWRVKKEDGTIVAIGSEGYVRRIDCEKAGNLFLDANPIGEY